MKSKKRKGQREFAVFHQSLRNEYSSRDGFFISEFRTIISYSSHLDYVLLIMFNGQQEKERFSKSIQYGRSDHCHLMSSSSKYYP